MGQAPSGDAYNTDGVGWPLIAGAGDFGDTYPVAKKYTTEASRLSQNGDIVLGIRASIGDKVLSDGVYCLGRGVAGLRPRKELDSRYLWHWLTSSRRVLASKAKGATFKQVNRDDISGLAITILPLPEQRRIADILDQADELRSKRQRALAQLDSLAYSLFSDMFGDPELNPKGWPAKRLDELATTTSGGTPDRSNHSLYGGSIPWVKSGELIGDTVTSTEEFLTPEGLKLSSAKLMPAGTVLVAMYGATAGQVSTLGIEAATNQAICCIDTGPELLSTYLVMLLRVIMPSFLEKRVGGAQPNLSQGMIRAIALPLPPLPMQEAFADRCRHIQRLRHSANESVIYLDHLFSSLQNRAFRGEL